MPVLQVNAITIFEQGNEIIRNLSFTICENEQWAITGASGSGKTSLLRALSRQQFNSGNITFNNGDATTVEKIVMVEQQHRFKNLSNTNTFYYQQRFNASDAEDAITVSEALQQSIINKDASQQAFSPEVEGIVDLLKLRLLLPVKLIQLSNGENKRLQIAKALLLQPTILLLDSPFTGLDVDARKVLVKLLQQIIGKHLHIILVTSPNQVPDFITHVLTLEKGGLHTAEHITAYRKRELSNAHPAEALPPLPLLKELLVAPRSSWFKFAVIMNHVNIQYNNRKILDDICWEVGNGECWSLSGPNGSGKSTLLSLISADNPQAYANDIYLFDRKRGSGETIWEIKKQIGFVSPELHLYFDSTISCFDVVASGFFDTIGLFRLLNERQVTLVKSWMKLLQVAHTSNTLFFRLSNSEQRLVLLARAMVKDPPLLILDEPCQGLDNDQVIFFRSMVNDICTIAGKTLIYVSHYPDEIPACINKFIRLENGRRNYD